MMFSNNIRHSHYTKTLSLFVAFTFFVSNIAYPQTQDYAQASQGASTQSAITEPALTAAMDLNKMFDINIPQNYGKIRDSFKGQQNKFLILIQDSHTNYEAQNNYAKVLDVIMQHVNLELIGVEGAEGDMDTILFSSIHNETVKKRVSDYLLKSGYINGAEYFGIFSEKVHLFGVETEDLYVSNLKTFQDAQRVREEQMLIIAALKPILKQLENTIFTPNTLSFLAGVQDYKDLKLPFTQYAMMLQDYCNKLGLSIAHHDNYTKLLSAIDIQKNINTKLIETERNDIIQELSRITVKEELQELINRSIAYKLNRISTEDYYAFLDETAAKAEMDLSSYPNLAKLINMLSIKKTINTKTLKLECDAIEEAVKEKLLVNPDQQELAKILYHVNIYERFIDLRLNRPLLKYYREHKKDFSAEKIQNFLQKEKQKHNLDYHIPDKLLSLDDHLDLLEEFYTLALQRDEAIISNTLGKMNQMQVNVAALVTGGFHTEGIMENLKASNISYMVITPRLTDLDAPT
ncbi:MAG: hypothetical protein Q8Q33_04585, partial [Chlamydiota bacterium]|nr:hypothetical protein [Chlamydiota bacterium]